jgi:hypothetical protein
MISMRALNQRSTSIPLRPGNTKSVLDVLFGDCVSVGARYRAIKYRLKLGRKCRAKGGGLRNHSHGFVERAVSNDLRQTHVNVTDHLFRRQPKIVRNQNSN